MFTGDLATTTARAAPLLTALRRTARPDLARVNAYAQLASRPAGDPDYRGFVERHQRWLAGLDRALADAAAPYGLPLKGPRLAATDAEAIAPVTSRAQGLAYLYVFEAFRLGCRVLVRQLRAVGVDVGAGGALLAEVGAGAERAWIDLSEALRKAAADEYGAVLENARALFAEWERATGASAALARAS